MSNNPFDIARYHFLQLEDEITLVSPYTDSYFNIVHDIQSSTYQISQASIVHWININTIIKLWKLSFALHWWIDWCTIFILNFSRIFFAYPFWELKNSYALCFSLCQENNTCDCYQSFQIPFYHGCLKSINHCWITSC